MTDRSDVNLAALQEQVDALCFPSDCGVFYFLNYGGFFLEIREILNSATRVCNPDQPHMHFAISQPKIGCEFMEFLCGKIGSYLLENTDADNPKPVFLVIPEPDDIVMLLVLRGTSMRFGYTMVKDRKAIVNAIHQNFSYESLVPVMVMDPEVISEADVQFLECEKLWQDIREYLVFSEERMA